MKKLMVTTGNGMFGRALVDSLAGRADVEVNAMVRNLDAFDVHADNVTAVRGDMDDPASLAAAVDGVTDVFLTKLDILTGWDRIPVCVGYDIDGAFVEHYPVFMDDLVAAKPVYEYLDGWTEDISGCRDFDELPATTQAYVRRLEELIRCRISGIGVGPGREQVVMLHDLLA